MLHNYDSSPEDEAQSFLRTPFDFLMFFFFFLCCSIQAHTYENPQIVSHKFMEEIVG